MKLFSALAQLIPVFLVGVILVLVTHMKKLGQPCQQPMATVHTWQSNRDVNFENQEFLPRPSKSEVVLSLSEANQSSTHRNQLEYDRLNFSKGFIEPIIHQMWKSESSIGSFGRNSQRSWQDLNPSYKYMFHTDADMEENMKEWHPELAHAWSQMKVIEKADTYRYAVVHRFGGYYADMDVVCEQPIDDWMAQYHVYVTHGDPCMLLRTVFLLAAIMSLLRIPAVVACMTTWVFWLGLKASTIGLIGQIGTHDSSNFANGSSQHTKGIPF
eukprot:m.1346976 g.1346976  ORF g.1346976 m.1346976 type:complete len:270 (+) comp24908_c2_seq11:248-1057(+)